jgi:xanthine/uracil permease
LTKQQAAIYLFKAWMTAAIVFPFVYIIYYFNFDKDPDGMIWIWFTIAIPWAAVWSIPCWLITYGCLLVIALYVKNIYWQKATLCLVTLLIVAAIYISIYGFTNNIQYSIGMVFGYWLILAGCIWLYQLKLFDNSNITTP